MRDNFFTEVKIEESREKISHKQSIMLIGSCFTDEIGNKFLQHGYSIKKNPFGILYNPLSIAVCLEKIAKKEYLTKEDLIKVEDYYYAYSCHGDYRARTEEECLALINNSIEESHSFLSKADYLILTLGSAWTYWHIPNNYLMGNCHKVESKFIERKMLSQQEIFNALDKVINHIRENLNPNLKVVITLSPIRHWREGWHDNLLSKSTLYLAIEDLRKNTSCYYFPSYEIVMDELRDYRFYAQDLLHVSETTVEYIWQKFSQTYFTKETQELNKRFYKLWTMHNHRPLNPDTEAYKKHLNKIEILKKELQKETIQNL